MPFHLRPTILASLPLGALLVAGVAGCGADPADAAAAAYVVDMQPVLSDNVALAQGFLDMAGGIKKGALDGGGVAERMARDVGPLAVKLHKGVLAVHPEDPQLADLHARLVKTWSDRANAYDAMSRAWLAGDEAAYEVARVANLQVKVAEEGCFADLNGWLGPHGQQIDQYP